MLIEIDGKNLQPIARVQKVIAQKEDVLVAGVETLTLKLLSQSQRAAITSGGPGVEQAGNQVQKGKKQDKRAFAVAGSIEMNSVPQGATVIIDGEDMGKTPVVIHNLAVGEVKVRLKRKSYRNVSFEVPVYKSKKTKVRAELFLSKSRPKTNTPPKCAFMMLRRKVIFGGASQKIRMQWYAVRRVYVFIRPECSICGGRGR